MTREVIFSPEALTDLFDLYDYIAADAGAARAHGYTDRIVATCRNLVAFPERGTRRDDLRAGLRTTTFRRRVTIAYHITETQVVIAQAFVCGFSAFGRFRSWRASPSSNCLCNSIGNQRKSGSATPIESSRTHVTLFETTTFKPPSAGCLRDDNTRQQFRCRPEAAIPERVPQDYNYGMSDVLRSASWNCYRRSSS